MRLVLRLATVSLLLAPASTLRAQMTRDSVVTVSSSRFSRIPADRVSFYLVVDGSAETTTDAIARAESKVGSVTEALKRLGDRVQFERPFMYSVGLAPVQGGYPGNPVPTSNVARSVMRLMVTRSEQVASVVSAALAAGATNVSNYQFESSVADSVRRARIADALTGARLDAEWIAASLGGKLGVLLDVSTNSGPIFQQPPQLNFDNRFTQQHSAPEISVTGNVMVRDRLVR